MAPSLRLLPAKQKRCPAERRVWRYLILRPPETLLSAHVNAVIRGAEKGEMHYCPPLATLHACEHLPLKNAFHSLTAAEGDKAGI